MQRSWPPAALNETPKLLAEDPYRKPPPFKKLIGDFMAVYLRHINILHCLVYQVLEDERVAKVLRLWSHYE
jgi:Txe/YoeB family toxin of Txe-Axe toxin-antitoxin module